jgi:RecB family exonuclease
MPDYPYFSCSRISTFRKCPRSFEFSYVQCLPQAFETIEKHMGSAVHEVFEWVYHELEEGRSPKGREVEACYREIWSNLDIASARIVKKDLGADDYFKAGLEMALGYLHRSILTETGKTLHIEHAFDYDLGGGRLYHGIIDRVTRLADGTLRLVDYKTGRSLPDVHRDLQLRSYCLPMFSLYGDDVIEICYEGLREGRSLTARIVRRDVAELTAEINRAVDEILACDVFGAAPSALCAWCGHLPRCPEGQARVDEAKIEVSDRVCPRCGGALKERSGRFGPFLSCSRFPGCRFTRNL